MSKLDQFESAFKSAAKSVYDCGSVSIEKVTVVSDLPPDQSKVFARDVADFLRVIARDEQPVEWDEHDAKPSEHVGDLLEEIERARPDLICTYRNIHGRAQRYPFSLGAHVDVLTQATTTPVLLLPYPTDEGRLSPRCDKTDTVMALTDHLEASDRLIDYAVHFTTQEGRLVLTHLEDDATFERYIGIIARIPAIDTEVARERIRERLLREASDYIGSVEEVLRDEAKHIEVLEEVRMGHLVSDCRAVIDKHEVDLVVMNTKDDDQLAMHGLAYPLAVELRDTPLLML
jgi:hypothetical protein